MTECKAWSSSKTRLWTASDFIEWKKDSLDTARQTVILPGLTTRLAIQPRVIPRPSHPMTPTQRLYPKPVPFRFDECEDCCLCAEQNRMAFFRISCSSRSNAYRCFSVEYASTRRRS